MRCSLLPFFACVEWYRILLHDLVEGRDKGLGEPEGEGELGTSHEQLGEQALEEGGGTLVLEHVGNDASASLLDLEVAVLDTGLDDVERSRDDERSRGTSNGCDKVLEPGGAVVVGELVEVFLGCGTTTEELCCASVTEYAKEKSDIRTANEPGALRAAVQPQPL